MPRTKIGQTESNTCLAVFFRGHSHTLGLCVWEFHLQNEQVATGGNAFRGGLASTLVIDSSYPLVGGYDKQGELVAVHIDLVVVP
jgi:hypothetical protein